VCGGAVITIGTMATDKKAFQKGCKEYDRFVELSTAKLMPMNMVVGLTVPVEGEGKTLFTFLELL